MELTTEQQEHISNAIVGLCMMILSTSIFHIYTTSLLRAGQRADTFEASMLFIPISMVLAGVWVIGLDLWVTHFGVVSMIQRNNSLIGGIVAANLGIFWTRLRRVPETIMLDYITNSLWSTYLGMVIGVLATYYFCGF